MKEPPHVVTFELTAPEIILAVYTARPWLLSEFPDGTKVSIEAYLGPTGGTFVATGYLNITSKEPATRAWTPTTKDPQHELQISQEASRRRSAPDDRSTHD